MQAASRIVAETLALLGREVAVGVTTHDLDRMAEEYIMSQGGKPAFKGYGGYPATICASVNEQVIHGIPSRKKRLGEGDIIGIDLGTTNSLVTSKYLETSKFPASDEQISPSYKPYSFLL